MCISAWEPHFHLKAVVFPRVGLWLWGLAGWGLASDWGPAREHPLSQVKRDDGAQSMGESQLFLPPANTSCLAWLLRGIPELLSTRGLEASRGSTAKNHRQGKAGGEFMSFLCRVSKWFGLCSSADSVSCSVVFWCKYTMKSGVVSS